MLEIKTNDLIVVIIINLTWRGKLSEHFPLCCIAFFAFSCQVISIVYSLFLLKLSFLSFFPFSLFFTYFIHTFVHSLFPLLVLFDLSPTSLSLLFFLSFTFFLSFFHSFIHLCLGPTGQGIGTRYCCRDSVWQVGGHGGCHQTSESLLHARELRTMHTVQVRSVHFSLVQFSSLHLVKLWLWHSEVEPRKIIYWLSLCVIHTCMDEDGNVGRRGLVWLL